jgi:CheY-like chemotaxis protein
LHGGSVRAKSAGVGQGATFAITLPVSIVHALPDSGGRHHPTAEISCASLPPPHLSGVHVLVIDDDPDTLEMTKRILQGCQARVTTATSGAEGLDLLKQERPDVVLSDIGMPEMNGYEFVAKVRSLDREHGGTVPIAALTALARSEDRRRAMLAGFDIHLAKPVDPAEMIAVVARLARRT